jgi:hypothetical protein
VVRHSSEKGDIIILANFLEKNNYGTLSYQQLYSIIANFEMVAHRLMVNKTEKASSH